MKWHNVYEAIQQGASVRLSSWGEGEYIRMADETKENNILYLVNQNEEYIELTEAELRSEEWEEVLPREHMIEELTDKEYLHRVREKCRARLQYESRLLISRLRGFAERQNALPVWEIGSDMKYYIAWSGATGKYIVECSRKEYINGVVYFNNRTACLTAIGVYQHLLDLVRDLDHQFNLLYAMDYTREQLATIDKMLDKLA